MTASVRVLFVLSAAAMALAVASTAFAAEATSIEDLLKDMKKGRWSSYAESQLPMKIEGRYAIFSTKLLRFLKCPELNFVWHDQEQGFPIDPLSLRSRTIEVYGRFANHAGKFVFLVEQLRELPSDEEKLRMRKIALVEAPADQWYALGDWAVGRGLFYDDTNLQLAAKEIFAEAVRREQDLLAADAVDAKIALSKKYTRYGLPEEDRLAFLHESFCRRWLSIKKKTDNKAIDLGTLSERLAENLRGCVTPSNQSDERLREQYDRDPLRMYRTSSPRMRLLLNRVLYAEIRFAYLEAWAGQENRDGMQLAERLDRQVPEYHAEAEALRGRALDERLIGVATLPRQEMLSLAEQFTRRNQPEKALAAKRSWVRAKEERLRKEGRPDDLIQAAHEYQSILEDHEGAAKILIEAYEKAPEMKTLADQLERLGWTRANGKWMTRAEAAALPPDPNQQAADAGKYSGMSREQIRKTLGYPDSVTRIISAGRVNEVWIYDQGARSRLSIHFLGGTDGRDVHVVRLLQ